MELRRGWVPIVAAAALLAGAPAAAQQAVSGQADGSVAVSVNGEQFVVPASVAQAVAAAVAEHSDDPEALQEAIRAIVAANAAGSDDANLAAAIAVLAIYEAGSDSAAVTAIVNGTTVANAETPVGSILEAIPVLVAEVDAQEDARQLAQLQATVENPSQVSPVQ